MGTTVTQTDTETDTQTETQTETQTDTDADPQTGTETETQTDTQTTTVTHTDTETDTQTDTQTDTDADPQTGTETNTQTEAQTDSQTDTQTDSQFNAVSEQEPLLAIASVTATISFTAPLNTADQQLLLNSYCLAVVDNMNVRSDSVFCGMEEISLHSRRLLSVSYLLSAWVTAETLQTMTAVPETMIGDLQNVIENELTTSIESFDL